MNDRVILSNIRVNYETTIEPKYETKINNNSTKGLQFKRSENKIVFEPRASLISYYGPAIASPISVIDSPIFVATNIGFIKQKIKENKVHFDEYYPTGFKNKATKDVIMDINNELAHLWKQNLGVDAFDIDIKLEFQKDPEERYYNATYTVFIPNLNSQDIPIVWDKLRTIFNEVMESSKRKFRRYRKIIEKLSEISFIQLDW